MSLFWRNLLTYLTAIPAAFLCCSLMRNQFKRSFRRTLVTVVAVLVLTIPVAAWADTYTSVEPGMIAFLLIVTCYVPYHLSTKCSFSKSVAIFLYVMAIMTLVSSVSTGIDAIVNPGAGEDEVTDLFIILQLGLTSLTAALLNIPFSKRGVKLIDRMDLPLVWADTVPTSLVCIVLNLSMMPADYSVLVSNHNIGSYFALVFLMANAYTSFTFSFYHTATGLMFASRTEERARILEMQKSQFDSQQKYLEESSAVRHDFRQTMYTMRGLLQDKDYDALEEYFESFYGSMPENEIIRFCLNQPLNALLNYYANKAHSSGIDLRLVVDPLDDVHISDVDLCTVVGNILDNALSACGTVEQKDRFIQLSVVNENKANLFIVESNSFDGKIRKRNDQYLSVKRDGTGIGLSSVTHIAESYGGSAEFTNDGSVFYSNVIIPLNNDNDNDQAAAE